MTSRILGALAVSVLMTGTMLAQRQQPPQNVSAKKHPNLAAAQRLVDQAFAKVSAAQDANEFDLGGHAAKAKQLLDEANKELKAAAETANKR